MDRAEVCRYIIHLIYSLLDGYVPDEKPDNISFEEIYQMSIEHNVCVMALSAIDHLNAKPEKNLYEEWSHRRDLSTAQGIVQIKEHELILKEFEKSKIQSVSLKGCLLKEMYPRMEYREMSDLDILINEKDRENTRNVMESLGYVTESFGIKKDDSYRKAPFMHVEIHSKLFEDVVLERLNLKIDLLINPMHYVKSMNNSMQCYLSNEDLYIYLLAHNAKHFLFTGCGIRQFIDLDLFKRNNKIDQDYVNKQLQHSSIIWFKEMSESLVNNWRKNAKTPDELAEMEMIVFASGSYGSVEGQIRNHMRRAYQNGEKSYRSYLIYRFFPPFYLMKAAYPALKNVPFLLPVFWLYRIIFKGIPKANEFKKELETISTIIENASEKNEC